MSTLSFWSAFAGSLIAGSVALWLSSRFDRRSPMLFGRASVGGEMTPPGN